ncbi:MAG: hypothetical protein ACRDGS_14820, partial [Chloroflexota bacterium]
MTLASAVGLETDLAYAPPSDPQQRACLYLQASVPQPSLIVSALLLLIPGLGKAGEIETGASFLTTERGTALSSLERVGSALRGDRYHVATSWVVDDPA